jgi:isochorismate synthase
VVRRRAAPAAARGAVRRMMAVRVDSDAPALRPRALGGFRFNPGPAPTRPWEDFGAGWLVLPRLLLVREGDVTGIVVAPGVSDDEVATALTAALHAPVTSEVFGANPLREVHGIDESAWCSSVGAIAADVRAGLYEKAVLATTVELAGRQPIDVGRALARLRVQYADCHLFTMRADGSTFLGASPELLVRLSGGQVEALGLAGSIGRGATPEDDERLGRELLESAKNRIEHETVVRAIRERLAGATEDLRAPNVPALRKLANIQHLSTEISGRVRPGVDVLELVRRLHPTPAVCGYPQDVAREVITSHERFDRGWYAGPIGWVDSHGEGEFAVALRSALVREDRAWLFAGNGIMGDSEPSSELAEVRLKFRPLTEALGGRADAAAPK